ncbi:helix-turn-helix transcriptional regulator [Fusibacter ferrireducens]|uniref:Helix-turn-helix transcriptional regulator n=1 Tax=Fusibacter ferrireducens TaxID=2785058 RepID=A0ABR9ZWT7_9FIRM|nr:helix-turn-helix transcriptional regulator [Fusibacter ferrireducens]MBF4694932.1 helix-turn-helix transcriptional regulator [Fusibacter ferrireducens]
MYSKLEKELQIRALQDSLSVIRKIAGWTMEDLGEKIGVTKQTISNLENQKTQMNLTQYIAIRAVFDFEIQNNKCNEILPEIIALLLDKKHEYSEVDQKKIDEATKTISAAAAGGINGAALTSLSGSLLSSIVAGAAIGAPIGPVGMALGSIWLSKILNSKNGKDKK